MGEIVADGNIEDLKQVSMEGSLEKKYSMN